MEEEKCHECGEMVESESLDRNADFFFCYCGNSWTNFNSFRERMLNKADFLKKLE
jgi:hypothetical protein|tara:strand:+ start:48 stop:212 length:165 start_codon:yes stop_codon:yes gene_type:complete